MDSRTCLKVPQRQMLVIAASMSPSVGCGYSMRRAATAMIMPLWQ
jgi:nucleoside recognition membrane protein YjiH